MAAPVLTPSLSGEDHCDGPQSAKLELVMYGDFQCPYCAAAVPIVGRVRERLAGPAAVRLPPSLPPPRRPPRRAGAAEAAEAAASQGAFWPTHDVLDSSRGALAVPDPGRRHAPSSAWTRPGSRMSSARAAHSGRVQRDVDSGEGSGVSGTPAFFVNGRLHEASFDAGSLMAALEA